MERRETKFDNGQLQELYYVKVDSKGDELKEGPYTSWNEKGHRVKECCYKYGKQDGPCIRWYQNGRVMFECVYQEGKIVALK